MLTLPPAVRGSLRIMVTNDDGIHAPGLVALEAIARELSDDVWVIAPEMEQSGASHSLTINKPLRMRQLGDKRFTVEGTPTDCVLLGVNHIMKGARPDLVLSGVNGGSNIGEDVTYSGTIAAAMEATLLSVPAIALSQHIEEGAPADFGAATAWGARVVQRLLARPMPRNTFLNVNFPVGGAEAVKRIAVVRHGKRKVGDELVERIDPRGRPYFWIGTLRGDADTGADTDVHVLFNGGISVTPLQLDLTYTPLLQSLGELFADTVA